MNFVSGGAHASPDPIVASSLSATIEGHVESLANQHYEWMPPSLELFNGVDT